MVYEFRCIEHPQHRWQILCQASERMSLTVPTCPVCGEPLEQDLRGSGGSWFKQTFGKWTGCYDYDYGRKATWDLTPPGKMEMLKRQGTIKDPFDSGPSPVTNDHLVGAI